MARPKHGTRGKPRPNPVGVVHITAGGYGFVETPEGEYFVPERKMGGAFDGDTVEVRPLSVNRNRRQPGKAHNEVGKNPTARVVGVVRRAHETLVGRYEIAEPFGVVVPVDDRIHHDIFTMHAENPSVDDGDLVRVRITQFPGRNMAATGVVEEVVGRAGAKGSDIDALVSACNLRVAFPPEALEAAEDMVVDAPGALAAGYRDLRDRLTFTIDPPDARDFDDALSLERVDGHWRLGVHIADVSWYVRPESAIDLEAKMRATSVYLVDRVLPMLPEALSAGVCSLAPGQDRRSMTVDIELDDDACVLDASFYPALIRSDARLDYGRVQQLLDAAENRGEAGISDEIATRLLALRDLSQKLKAERSCAGALDLETAEAHVLLDEEGHPVDVAVRRSTEATELVEHCMILANTLVAQRLSRAGEPTLYRVHEAPDAGSLAQMVPFLEELGFGRAVDLELFASGSVHEIRRVLELSRAGEAPELVSMLLLRSLKRATYSADCESHYGLALGEYLHFTSPIRRYPDLVAHRALKRVLAAADAGERAPSRAALVALAQHSSAMERAADDAARQSQQMKLVEYLVSRVGEEFEAVVVKVSPRGLLVRLDNTATGFAPLGQAGDESYAVDVRRQAVVGLDTGTGYRLGQRVRVRLVAARPSSRELDFQLLGV